MNNKNPQSGSSSKKAEDENKNDSSPLSLNRRSALGIFAALGVAGLSATPSAADENEFEDVSVDDDRPVGTEALLQLIVDEYGDMLTDEDIAQLEDSVASHRTTSMTLRDFDLANGDDMAMVFKAYRGSY